MKKLVGALAGFIASALIASPVNNPASSTQFETGMYTGAQQDYTFRVAYVGDATGDRKLEVKPSRSHVDRASLTENAISLSLGLYNRFDIFARAGQVTFSALSSHAGDDVKIETAPGFRWAAGGRAVLWTQDNLTLNLFGEYGRFKADVNAVRVGAFNSGYTNAHARMRDWHVGLGFANTIQVSPDMAVVPTIAVKYSDARVRFDNDRQTINSIPTMLDRMDARTNVGVAIGCGLYAGKVFGLNVEGRFIDESAIGVNAEIRL